MSDENEDGYEIDESFQTMYFDQVVEDQEGNDVPIRIELTFPMGAGVVALSAMHEASHSYIQSLYQVLLKAGDKSAEYLESRILLSQLDEELSEGGSDD